MNCNDYDYLDDALDDLEEWEEVCPHCDGDGRVYDDALDREVLCRLCGGTGCG